MGTKDPRVDAYIAKSAEFARPILKHIRALMHKGCPDAVETMKWSMPHFEHEGVLCNMAAFKAHCSFGFWKGDMIKIESKNRDQAMGDFGRITLLSDLPSDRVLIQIIKEAARLNEQGIKRPAKPKSTEKKDLVVPRFLTDALKQNARAAKQFDAFSYSHKKEYVEWITEAKTEATQQRRLAQAIEWMAEGKLRHWRFQNC